MRIHTIGALGLILPLPGLLSLSYQLLSTVQGVVDFLLVVVCLQCAAVVEAVDNTSEESRVPCDLRKRLRSNLTVVNERE